NKELARENERLRKSGGHEFIDNELLSHPYFEKYGNEFEEFKQKYEKFYETKHEEHRRKLIFLNRMQQIDELNNDETNLLGNSYASNQFTDMTDDEIKKVNLKWTDETKHEEHRRKLIFTVSQNKKVDEIYV
uniref:Cathepsin propeptide inhibitor domain-containing protein n=1 Tax=Panagrolaimus sp. ES5 TaxID=591445 RepID=A0AC34GMH0_9BILA